MRKEGELAWEREKERREYLGEREKVEERKKERRGEKKQKWKHVSPPHMFHVGLHCLF